MNFEIGVFHLAGNIFGEARADSENPLARLD